MSRELQAPPTANRPLKTLHIVENLNRGAVENWLVRMLRHGRSRGIDLDWTFYCTLGREGKLDEEVRALGGRIVHSPVPLGETRAFMRALREELRNGDYEVLHCHHDLVSAVYLLAAEGIPLRKRFVHVHNADESVPTPNRLKAAILRPLLRQTCLTLADGIIGISNHTLDTFLAGRPRRPGRDRVHYYGIDSAPFLAATGDRIAFRRELGLPDNTPILLFAGRIVPEKNPLFAVDVLAELRSLLPGAAGVFVGTGSLEQPLLRRAADLGLIGAFRALGWRGDIPEIMACCDWFILPRPQSPMEGLGIAVVEAQLAGLRLLLSKGIADDALLPGALSRRLALADGPRVWANHAIDLIGSDPLSRADASAALAASPFDLDHALQDLQSLHSLLPASVPYASTPLL